MATDFNKFYCESAGQKPGLPEGWQLLRALFGARANRMQKGNIYGSDATEDRLYAENNGYHIIASGLELGKDSYVVDGSSSPDSRGGRRVFISGTEKHHLCAICGSPIRFIDQ